METGRTGLGSELFRQAIEKDPNLSTDKRRALASESLAHITRAIELNPDQSLAHYQLAAEMAFMGQYNKALLILKGLKKQIIDADITLSSIAKNAMQQKVQTALDGVAALQSSHTP